jgi:predicted dehydrogenase
MGSTHARAYSKLPDVEVVGVTSRTPPRGEALARELGCRYVVDPDALIADPRVEAIDVSVPTPEHARYAIAALRAGKHVLAEKPLAMTREQARAILDAWRASGKVLMVAHVLRFWPEYVALHDLVARGEIGRPVGGFAWRLSTSSAANRFARDPASSGGAVLDLQIHDLDQLNWLFGRPLRVEASGVRTARGAWDHIYTLVSYHSCSAAAEGSMLLPSSWPFSMGLRVVGTQGAVEYAFRAAGPSVEMGRQSAPGVTLYLDNGEPRPIEVASYDAYVAEIVYFVDCVRRGIPAERASPDDAYLALELALAARQSLDTGSPIDLTAPGRSAG